MDWKEQLSRLREDPNLPAGEEMPAETSEEAAKETPKKGTLHIVIDKKGRKGKVATIIEGFTCDDEELGKLSAFLKKKLGLGGSHRGGEILIQGDCRERVAQLLRGEGYKVK